MKNPFLNALSATAYISVIASLMFYMSEANIPETVIIPITILSLLVISVAMMGYFFIYQPVWLLIQNKQKEAIKFFFTTILSFVCTTGFLISIWLFALG